MAGMAMSLAHDTRREFRRMLVYSAAAHLGLLLAFVYLPSGLSNPTLQPVVTVDLIGSAPASRPAARAPKPRPAPPPPKAKPAPKPAPKPQPKPEPKPVPVAKKVVLPAQPTQPPAPPKPQAKEEPKPEAKPAPKPKPEPKPEPKPKPKPELSYNQVLAKLRAETGEKAPSPAPAATPKATAGQGSGSGASGTLVSPAVAEWIRAARIKVGEAWVLPEGFRQQPLETHVEVTLDANGDVVGVPKVTQGSGNPWYDDTVVRAIQKASPLPPPPQPGAWPFVFRPEDAQ